MIQFILNDKLVNTDLPPGMVMVDFIRYHKHLTGTKIGCREGDCGACTVLSGEIKNGQLDYKAVSSCLMPLANAAAKHIITVEGINLKEANAIQQAITDEAATQCGFCTPGIVMSLAGYCLQGRANSGNAEDHYRPPSAAIAAVDGNICRCTGYKSIQRAAMRIHDLMQQQQDQETISFLINSAAMPAYLQEIFTRLQAVETQKAEYPAKSTTANGYEQPGFVSGGTDLFVQQPEALLKANPGFLSNHAELKGILKQDNICLIGGATTVTDLLESPVINEFFPGIAKYIKLVSSTPIRNMGTLAGNFVNASPIGDLTIFFMAMDAQLVLTDNHTNRTVALQEFYQGYKILAKNKNEYIREIRFRLPGKNTYFNFEKVSKRTHLDIATVNTALQLTVENNMVSSARISAGGVGPVPMFLAAASDFLKGQPVTVPSILKTIQLALSEVSPISDIRGTATYKRLLLSQLIKAHFITIFPYLNKEQLLFEGQQLNHG